MKNFFILLLISLFAFGILLSAAPLAAKGATLGDSMTSEMKTFGDTAYGAEATKKSLTVIVGGVINALLGLFGIILTVLMLYSGYMWMTAAGDEGKVTKAKDTIKNSAIGLAIIVASYAIANFIIGMLVETSLK